MPALSLILFYLIFNLPSAFQPLISKAAIIISHKLWWESSKILAYKLPTEKIQMSIDSFEEVLH